MKHKDQNDCGEVEEHPQTKIISYDVIKVSSQSPQDYRLGSERTGVANSDERSK